MKISENAKVGIAVTLGFATLAGIILAVQAATGLLAWYVRYHQFLSAEYYGIIALLGGALAGLGASLQLGLKRVSGTLTTIGVAIATSALAYGMGTLLQGLVCAAISIPVGVFVGIYLVEYGGSTRLGRVTTFMVDILTGVPSIVAALFIYALWVATFGFPRSGFAVSLALVLLMIPVIVRSTEEMLRIVPMDLREASYALGVPKWKTIARIVIPTALSGIVTGIMLALARVMGETAPLLVLVGYSQAINFDMFNGFQGSLPGMMYDQVSAGAGANPVPTDRLWGAALTLIILVAVLNVGARFLAKFFAPKKF